MMKLKGTNLGGALVAVPGLLLLSGLLLVPHRPAQAQQGPARQDPDAGLTAEVAALRTEDAALRARLAALEAKTAPVSLAGRELTITGVNVHIVSGSGATDDHTRGDGAGKAAPKLTGLGNLIIGYNEASDANQDQTERNPAGDVRTGSHNLVLGRRSSYSGFGGLVAGDGNTITGDFSVVAGGAHNRASGACAAVSGGINNAAGGPYASVSGGETNTADGGGASVSGGFDNVASAGYASVSGGDGNAAVRACASVAGGAGNRSQGQYAAVGGGLQNTAGGPYAAIGGGRDLTQSAQGGWAAGGRAGHRGIRRRRPVPTAPMNDGSPVLGEEGR